LCIEKGVVGGGAKEALYVQSGLCVLLLRLSATIYYRLLVVGL